MEQQPTLKDLLTFPCLYPYKVVAEAHPELMEKILTVIQKYAPGDYSPTVTPSKNGKYHSVTVTINATDIEQVEILYKELAALEKVRMVL